MTTPCDNASTFPTISKGIQTTIVAVSGIDTDNAKYKILTFLNTALETLGRLQQNTVENYLLINVLQSLLVRLEAKNSLRALTVTGRQSKLTRGQLIN